MASNYGTNFFSGNSGVQVALTDASGNAVLARGTVANLPSGVANYAVSCIYMATDSGALYENTGTASSATFTLIDTAAASLTLPLSVADATSTTGDSFLITETTLTSGNGVRVLGTTGVLTTGGALFKADLSAAVAGNGFVAVTTGVYTGTGLLTLTAASATTGTIASIAANGLTSGIALSIASSATAITGAGRLLYVNHSGATGTSAILSEFISSSNDETIVLQVTANSNTTSTGVVTISATGLTSGTALSVTGGGANMTAGGSVFAISMGAATDGIGFAVGSSGVYTGAGILRITCAGATTGVGALITMNGLTSGAGLSIVSSSADTTARGLLSLTSSSSSATGAAGIKFTMAALSTNFRKLFYESNTGITVWMGNGTTGQGNLSGTAGDLLINGGTNKPEYCTGTTNWTALA